MRIADDAAPDADSDALVRRADAIVLDARVAGALGGTGRAFDWDA